MRLIWLHWLSVGLKCKQLQIFLNIDSIIECPKLGAVLFVSVLLFPTRYIRKLWVEFYQKAIYWFFTSNFIEIGILTISIENVLSFVLYLCVSMMMSQFLAGWKIRTVHTSCMNFTHDCICLIKISGKTNWCRIIEMHFLPFFSLVPFSVLILFAWNFSEQMRVHWDRLKSIHFASNRIGYKNVIIFQFTQFFTWTNCWNKVSGKLYFILAQKCILCSTDDGFSYVEREKAFEKRSNFWFYLCENYHVWFGSCWDAMSMPKNESFESSPQLLPMESFKKTRFLSNWPNHHRVHTKFGQSK